MATGIPIEEVLDERHAAANTAFANRDAAAYERLFGNDLEYVQADGTAIDRARLMKDVKAQLRKLDRAASSFVREKLTVDGHEVSEALRQIATVETLAFGFIRRIWRVERNGLYTWAMEDGRWKIVRVQVLNETLNGRWKIGWPLGHTAI